MKPRKYISIEEFEDTKGVIRIRKLKKGRQHNGQKKMDKMCSGRISKSSSTDGINILWCARY